MLRNLQIYSRNIHILWIVILLSSLAVNLITPVWPIYIHDLGASMTELGYVMSLSNAMTAILQIPSGWISDRYGRRKIHILGSAMGVLPPLIYTFARSWTDLIPWVIISGVSMGLYTPARWSIVADDSTAKTRALAYGWINISWLIGNVAGPLMGGFLADSFGIKMPFLMCFTFSCMYLPLVFLIKETRGRGVSEEYLRDGCYNSEGFLSAAAIFFLINVLQGVCFGVFFTVTPIFMSKRFSADFFYVGLINAVGYGLAAIIAQIPGGVSASKYSKKSILIVTALASAPFYLLLPSSRSIGEYLLYIFASNVILAFSWPAFQELMMDAASPAKWGLMNGLAATSYWAGMMVGSAVSGLIWDIFGMFMPYYFAALMIILSVIPMLPIKHV